jgi:hypothetical protein
MTRRENLLSLYRRQGYEHVPVGFGLCPALEAQYKAVAGNKGVIGTFKGRELAKGYSVTRPAQRSAALIYIRSMAKQDNLKRGGR